MPEVTEFVKLGMQLGAVGVISWLVWWMHTKTIPSFNTTVLKLVENAEISQKAAVKGVVDELRESRVSYAMELTKQREHDERQIQSAVDRITGNCQAITRKP